MRNNLYLHKFPTINAFKSEKMLNLHYFRYILLLETGNLQLKMLFTQI